MLRSLQGRLERATSRVGRFAVMVVLSIVSGMMFCNQTIATLMCNDLLEKTYEETDAGREELAIDMENSVILIACFIPWTIGCTVPLSFFGVGVEAMVFAFFMYLTPVWYLFGKRLWFKSDVSILRRRSNRQT
jgi:NhaC family Na+:H+ antiporter